ncbi:O-acetyl-ADP-ribose deacetylase [Polystyrenella longa]|uniref:O-acetyl-ADP-ribose deacetylase n=1 Tax=Polystyrenella longa TaxID=2528007 RepID=A0A518CMW0_9PLAN|nr:macro domain-containing protein [Polystyrenella longa]QDU80561.1 O-acetyl-ADP-ribose deacetylase [Polystyrenella longa]
MLMQFGESLVELIQGDITQVDTDAIVNAANSQLAGGGGVDGAIHRAAGPNLMQETKRLYPEGCPTGSAVATRAGNMQMKYIFHAVGPIWRGGGQDEEGQLRSACIRCLELALEHNCDSIAFPAISTGVYRFPIDLAAQILLRTIHQFVIENQSPRRVVVVLFDEGSFGAFSQVLESFADS